MTDFDFDLAAARALARVADDEYSSAIADVIESACAEVERLRAERDAANAKLAAALRLIARVEPIYAALVGNDHDSVLFDIRMALASAEAGEKETTK